QRAGVRVDFSVGETAAGGTGGCRAGRSTRSRPNLNSQRFLRSFLRHFQQPRGAVARRAPSPICKVDSTPPFGPGFDGDMPYPPEKITLGEMRASGVRGLL